MFEIRRVYTSLNIVTREEVSLVSTNVFEIEGVLHCRSDFKDNELFPACAYVLWSWWSGGRVLSMPYCNINSRIDLLTSHSPPDLMFRVKNNIDLRILTEL